MADPSMCEVRQHTSPQTGHKAAATRAHKSSCIVPAAFPHCPEDHSLKARAASHALTIEDALGEHAKVFFEVKNAVTGFVGRNGGVNRGERCETGCRQGAPGRDRAVARGREGVLDTVGNWVVCMNSAGGVAGDCHSEQSVVCF